MDNAFLTGLPTPAVIEELSVETILADIEQGLVARLPAIAPILALESSATKTNIEAVAYREVMVRASINDAARSNLLAYATGSDLDHVGANSQPPVSRMVGEGDARFRERILLSGMARNVGSPERYKLIAMNASMLVRDALSYRLGRDPTIFIALLSTDLSGIASASLISTVQAAMDLPVNRMVNGNVVVRSAVSSVANITAELVVNTGVPPTIVDSAERNIRAAWATEGGLGRDLTIDWIKARLMLPGVYSANILAPSSSVVVPPYQAASIGSVTLTVVGENT